MSDNVATLEARIAALEAAAAEAQKLAAENKALKTKNDKLEYRVKILVRTVDDLNTRAKAAEAAAAASN